MKKDDKDDSVKKTIGRRPINSTDRRNVSKRAMKGKLEVIKTKKTVCPKCHNQKFLNTDMMGTKCSRCKTRLKL